MKTAIHLSQWASYATSMDSLPGWLACLCLLALTADLAIQLERRLNP